MTKKPETRGTLLYPGAVLRGENIIINPGPTMPKLNANRKSKTIRKIDLLDPRNRDKTFVNLLIEEKKS